MSTMFVNVGESLEKAHGRQMRTLDHLARTIIRFTQRIAGQFPWLSQA